MYINIYAYMSNIVQLKNHVCTLSTYKIIKILTAVISTHIGIFQFNGGKNMWPVIYNTANMGIRSKAEVWIWEVVNSQKKNKWLK